MYAHLIDKGIELYLDDKMNDSLVTSYPESVEAFPFTSIVTNASELYNICKSQKCKYSIHSNNC